MKYAKHVAAKATPQTMPVPGKPTVPNSAGGYSFAVDDWVRLDRFLILGCEGGSYYATEQKLTAENAEAVVRCAKADGAETVRRIVAVSDAGRAPKNDPAIFALALVAANADAAGKKAAYAAVSSVCRTGTHLFQFAAASDALRGWGRGLRQAIADWYLKKDPRAVAYQVTKYQQRDGWSHRDVLRLAHPRYHDRTRRVVLGLRLPAHSQASLSPSRTHRDARFLPGPLLFDPARFSDPRNWPAGTYLPFRLEQTLNEVGSPAERWCDDWAEQPIDFPSLMVPSLPTRYAGRWSRITPPRKVPMKRTILTVIVGIGLVPSLPAADWTQFRGSDGTGVSTETKLPTEWSATKNVAWKVSVPGVAWSCPIVVGDRVLVTTAITENQTKPSGGGGGGGRGPGGGGAPNKEYTWKVVCLNRETGKEEWSQKAAVGKPKYGAHGSNTFATETPVSDGERVYAYFPAGGIAIAFDLKGKEVWKKEIGSFPMQNNWGTASSPVVHDGKLFIQCDNEEKSFVVAIDALTGKESWRVDRKERTSWSTPYIWKTKTRTDLVVLGQQKVIGYDPASGKANWELTLGGGQCNTSPVGTEEMLYVGTSMGGGGRPGGGGGRPVSVNAGTLYAVKAGAKGDISLKDGQQKSADVVWSVAKAMPSAASPLVYEGFIYTFDRQGGTVSCYDAKTGDAKYTKERIPRAGAFWASPWAYDGKVFALDDTGTTHVLKAGDTFDVLRTNSLDKETCWATPAVSGGSVIIRGVDSIYCIR